MPMEGVELYAEMKGKTIYYFFIIFSGGFV